MSEQRDATSRRDILDLLTRVHSAGQPIDMANGDFDARLPADLWRELTDLHAAMLYESANAPVADTVPNWVEGLLRDWERREDWIDAAWAAMQMRKALAERTPSEMVTTPEGGRDHAFLSARLSKASVEVNDPSLGQDMRLAATVINEYDREFNAPRAEIRVNADGSAYVPSEPRPKTCVYPIGCETPNDCTEHGYCRSTAPTETRFIWCDNCRAIQPLVIGPMDGTDVTGKFTKPADLLCGDCRLVIATTYAAPQEEHTQRPAIADAGGHHPAGAAPVSAPSARGQFSGDAIQAARFVYHDRPIDRHTDQARMCAREILRLAGELK